MKWFLRVGLGLLGIMTLAEPSGAIAFLGTPNPSLFPRFGTLINFDDRPPLPPSDIPAGVPILPSDYVSLGVASITETERLGTFARYATSAQSNPSYIGTGPRGERGTDANEGWDGTILIELQNLANSVGIGIADSRGAAEVLSIYDSGFNLLETFTAPVGLNSYVYFTRNKADIKYFQIKGDFFAVDDLQFSTARVAEPTAKVAWLAFGAFGAYAILKGKQSKKADS